MTRSEIKCAGILEHFFKYNIKVEVLKILVEVFEILFRIAIKNSVVPVM